MKYDWLKEYEDGQVEPIEMDMEERARVLENALSKLNAGTVQTTGKSAEKTGKPRKKRRFLRRIALLAAVLCIGMITASAASGYEIGDILYTLFGTKATPEFIEALGASGYPLGQSQTKGGYTVTLLGIIGDRHNSHLVFELSAPEGETFSEFTGYTFEEADLSFKYSGSGSQFFGPAEHYTDPERRTLRFEISNNENIPIIGQTATLYLGNLKQYELVTREEGMTDEEWEKALEQRKETILVDDFWYFEFPVKYADNSFTVPVSEELHYETTDAVLTKIQISSLAVRLEYRMPTAQRLFGKTEELSAEEELQKLEDLDKRLNRYSPELTLHFADRPVLRGEDTIFSGGSHSSSSKGLTRASRDYEFDQVIDREMLVSVEIDGVIFPVK